MTILTLQQRTRELGRIRLGQVVATANGKTRPAKLDRFRITSPSRPLLEQVAALYGGQVVEWTPQGGGAQQWEVLTDSTRLPVLVPPQPVSQFFELWAGGRCKRRCDGVTELLSDTGCLCDPDPGERDCKPTTRLNVVLRDVPGIGVFRVETHGYYAAVELPQSAMFLAQAGGYVNGYLALEPRRIVREVDGKLQTRDFMVPTLEIDITPAELMAGKGRITAEAVDARPGAPALEAGTAARDFLGEAKAATSLDEVKAIWRAAGDAGVLDDALKNELTAIGNALVQPDAPPADVEPDVEIVWQQVLAAAGDLQMSIDDVDQEFAQTHGGLVIGDANGWELADYLADLKRRAAA